MKRFCCVVFDYNQIDLFFLNFFKFKNYNIETDKIIIITCNTDQNYLVKLNENSHKIFGRNHVDIIHRKNWGIDQGAKIDFFLKYFNKYAEYDAFLFMQEHFLDNTSEYAFYGKAIRNIDHILVEGTLKEDVLNPNFNLDLNQIVDELKTNMIVFPALNGCVEVNQNDKIIYLGDGGNVFISKQLIVASEIITIIPELILKYDRTYRWTLFVEIELSNYLSQALSDEGKKRLSSLSTTKLNPEFVKIYDEYKYKKLGFFKKIIFKNKLLIPIYSLFLKKLLMK